MVSHFIIFLLLLFSWHSYGSLSFLPQGQVEAISGNIGIARSASVGANIYNPASLFGLEGNSLSASGTILSSTYFDIGGGTIEPIENSRFNTQLPGYFASVHKYSDSYWSLFINTENSFYLENYYKLNTALTSYSSVIKLYVNMTTTALGASYSASTSKNWSWGALLKLNLVNSHNYVLSKQVIANTYSSSFQDSKSTTNILTFRIGTLWNPQGHFSVGGFIQPSGNILSNERTQFNYSVYSDGSQSDLSNNNTSELNIPFQSGLGVKYDISSVWTMFADYIKGNSEDYKDEYNSIKKTSEEIGYGASLEYHGAKDKKWYIGINEKLYTNDTKEKTTYFSLGTVFKVSFLKTLLGGYFTNYQELETKDSSQSKADSVGVIFSTEYSY